MIEFQVVLGIHRASRPASLADRSGSDGQAAESAAQAAPWGRLEDVQKSPQRTSGFPRGYQIHGLSPYPGGRAGYGAAPPTPKGTQDPSQMLRGKHLQAPPLRAEPLRPLGQEATEVTDGL
jgi:hypothetical protein